MQAAVEDWFKLQDAYYKASDAYNARLALVRAERDRGNWTMTIDPEYQALTEAQRKAFEATDALYRFLKASRATITTGKRENQP